MNTINSIHGKLLLNQAAFTIIVEQAPDELPQFESLRDHYLKDPNGYLRMHAKANQPLEFGGTEVLEYITIAVFPLLNSLLGWLIEHVAKKLADTSAEAAGKEVVTRAIEVLQPLFARKPEPKPLFTIEELRVIAKQLNQIAAQEAAELGLKPHDVEIIRDMVISRLTLAQRT